jgi:hypothetical protein
MKTLLLGCGMTLLGNLPDGPVKQQEPRSAAEAAPAPKRKAPSPEQAREAMQAELMRAVFGRNYDARRGVAVAELPNPEDRELQSRYVIEAEGHTVLPTGETLLASSAVEADAEGNPMSYHAAAGLLNLHVLRKQNGQWRVLKRHENVAAHGSSGNLGFVSWEKLGKNKTALAISHGGLWQGYTLTALSLYDVSGGDVRSLTKDGINIHSSNGGVCMPTSSCWEVTGTWSFVAGPPEARYDDLLIRFSGEESKPVRDYPEDTDAKEVERTAKPIQGEARYRFDGTQYTLVEGSNLVPDI